MLEFICILLSASVAYFIGKNVGFNEGIEKAQDVEVEREEPLMTKSEIVNAAMKAVDSTINVPPALRDEIKVKMKETIFV